MYVVTLKEKQKNNLYNDKFHLTAIGYYSY